MIIKNHLILYVKDQTVSTEFYTSLLEKEPALNVPGMTEFNLSEHTILGIMPAADIRRLLEDKVQLSNDFIKAELYFVVDDLEHYVNRAKSLKIKIISDIQERNWGHNAAYFLDPDNYVIAFAEVIKESEEF